MPTQGTSSAAGGSSLRRGLIGVWCLVAVGCAGVANAPTNEALVTTEATEAAATPPAAAAAMTSEPVAAAIVTSLPDSTGANEEPSAAELEQATPSVSMAASEPSELAVIAAAVPATEELEPTAGLNPSLVASSVSPDALDFSSLVTRLRKTKAINLRTKVAVKNESDDLLEQARAYHAKTGETTLADLRRAYDSLFQELHSLLEEADPPLARDIDRSRAAIWEILADPRKFSAAI